MEGIRRPGKALTARFVETARQPGKYFDGNGLFLRVLANGKRQWVQRIVIRGKRSELGLGSAELVPLAQARQQALENRQLARDGGDPLAARRQAADAMTFAEAGDRYLAVKLNEFRNEKHRLQWQSTLNTYAIPILGGKLVGDITVQDILRVLQPIWDSRTETASRLRGRIELVLSWATVAGYRSGDNPACWKGNLSELLPKPGKIAAVTHHPAIALDDLHRWWQALCSREGMAARALQFAVLTAARSGEVRGMTWAEIDLDRDLWTAPAVRMKARREHRVPLTQAAKALLVDQPRLEGTDIVFFSPRGKQLSDMTISALMRRVHVDDLKRDEVTGKDTIAKARRGFFDARSGRPAVPHGLRSTFRDWAAEAGHDPIVVELSLAHNVGSAVERAYRRSDLLERRRRLMDSWAQFLSATYGAENVLPLHRVVQ